MIADEVPPQLDGPAIGSTRLPANDNDDAVVPVIDKRILVVARAIGHQIARDQLGALRPDNDSVNDAEDAP